jgi:hypothetical protein
MFLHASSGFICIHDEARIGANCKETADCTAVCFSTATGRVTTHHSPFTTSPVLRQDGCA